VGAAGLKDPVTPAGAPGSPGQRVLPPGPGTLPFGYPTAGSMMAVMEPWHSRELNGSGPKAWIWSCCNSARNLKKWNGLRKP